SHIPHTFCRILLLDESGMNLVVKASHCSDAAQADTRTFAASIAFSEFPQLRDKLESSSYILLRGRKPETQRVLEAVSTQLGLKKNIKSLLIVRLRLASAPGQEEKLVGMLEFGEL